MTKLVFAFLLLISNAAAITADSQSLPLQGGRVDASQATYVFGDAKTIATAEASVNTCIAVALHDPLTNSLFFAHIDASTDVEKSLGLALEKFDSAGVPRSRLRSYIAGGWVGWSDQDSANVKRYLKNADVQNVVYEAPIDIGYSLKDAMDLKPISAKKKYKLRESRTYVFDLRRQRFYQTDVADAKNTAALPIPEGLVRGPLPRIYAKSTEAEAPPPTPSTNAPAAQ